MPKRLSNKPSASRKRAKIAAASLLEGKSKTQACLDAGESPASAHGQNLLKQPAFKGTILDALDNAQGRLDEAARIHGKLLHSDNEKIQLGAVELNYKARNLLNSKVDVEVKGPITLVVKEFTLKKKSEPENGNPTS